MALAVLMFGLLVWPGLAEDFSNKFRLSTSLPYKAFNPDIAATGDYVAAVWSEGYDSDSQTKQYGRVYVKGADATSGWKGRVKLFDATQHVRGREPRLVFDPNVPGKVHVVWAQSSKCSIDPLTKVLVCSWSSIEHTTCTLGSTIDCEDPTTVREGLADASTPDVAVDSSGGIHVVWREEGPSFDVGPIRYCKKGSCGSPSLVGNGQHPSLAYANDYLHLVWDTSSSTDSTIKYAHKSLPGGSWGGAKTWWSSPPSWVSYYEPSYPALGASGNAVYVVWAVRNETDSTKYALRFDFSENTGNSWLSDPYSFGSGRSIPENEATSFASTWRSIGIPADDLYSLQPDVVVTGSGSSAYAHLVWHDKNVDSGLYQIWYSYLAGYSPSGPPWTAPAVAVEEYNKDTELPAIALGATLDQTHLAFVRNAKVGFQDINVWYAGGNGNRINDPDDKIWMPLIFKNAQ